MKIDSRISRIDLHNSNLEILERTPDKLMMKIDWAIIEDYLEADIQEPVILEETQLCITGVCNETLEKRYNGCITKEDIALVNDRFKCQIIGYEIDDVQNTMRLNIKCRNRKNEKSQWLFSFENCEIEAHNYIKLSDFYKGRISNYLGEILSA